jgi:hypothetical protein
MLGTGITKNSIEFEQLFVYYKIRKIYELQFSRSTSYIYQVLSHTQLFSDLKFNIRNLYKKNPPIKDAIKLHASATQQNNHNKPYQIHT